MTRSSSKQLSPFHSSSLLHMNIPSCSHFYLLRSFSTLFSSAPFHLSVISISPLRHLHFTSPSSPFHLSVISISPLRHLHFTSLSSPFHLSVISISSLSSGMIESAVEAIKASLDDLPGLPRTYFGDFHTIHTILLIHSLIVMCSGDFPCFKC